MVAPHPPGGDFQPALKNTERGQKTGSQTGERGKKNGEIGRWPRTGEKKRCKQRGAHKNTLRGERESMGWEAGLKFGFQLSSGHKERPVNPIRGRKAKCGRTWGEIGKGDRKKSRGESN